MVLEGAVEIPQELVSKLEILVIVLQAVGVFIILYIIFGIVNVFINARRNRKIEDIRKSIKEIKQILMKK